MYPVSTVHCRDYDRARISDAVARAVDLLGGIGSFVPPGAKVLVKPNLLLPKPREKRLVTDPEVVRAVVELALEAGASEVVVGDSPGVGTASAVARACGLTHVLADTGVQVVDLAEPVIVKGEVFPRLEIAKSAMDADVVINVAKGKTHAHTGLTLCTKNLFGCVPGMRKGQWHLRAARDKKPGVFAKVIVDIANCVKPALNVLDAVACMEGNGPSSGTPRQVGVILAGANAAAVDVAAAHAFGFRPEESPVQIAAHQMGLGPYDHRALELVGDDLQAIGITDMRRAVGGNVRCPLPLPGFIVDALRRHATPHPVFDAERCRRCGKCVEVCPAGALELVEGEELVPDYKACIRCFCCQEYCPHEAITVGQGLLARLLAR